VTFYVTTPYDDAKKRIAIEGAKRWADDNGFDKVYCSATAAEISNWRLMSGFGRAKGTMP
jgi:hypothetical protein